MATAYAYREVPSNMPEEADPQSLEAMHESLDLPGWRVEILEGRIVVNPTPARIHDLIITWLVDALKDSCDERAWERHAHSTVELTATQERIEPDLLVCAADDSASDEWLVPARDAVLIVEVVSRSSRRDDYEVKRRGCAQSGIPLYLVVDPATGTATMFSEPGERDGGYLNAAPIQLGGKLTIPEPLGVILDTATMPVRRNR